MLKRASSAMVGSIYAQEENPMVHKKGTKLKVPYTPQDITRLEDGLHKIAGILRDIRNEMEEMGMPDVELKIGTLRKFVDDYTPKINGVLGEFRTEKVKFSVEKTRASVIEREKSK